MNKPNILTIYSDQHRFDCLGINGHLLLKTPNLDRLAAEGVNFTNAFTPCPMCVPARCSMISGQWPSQHGVVFNFDGETFKPLDPALPTLGRILTANGYDTIHIDRWHVDPKRTPYDFGFNQYIPAWRYDKQRAARDFPPSGCGSPVWAGNTDPVPQEETRLAWGADQVIKAIRENKDTPDAFSINWHTVEPHQPCCPPEPYASMYNPADIQPWPGFGDTFNDKPEIQQQMLRTWGVEGWTWKQWAPVVARYFGIITQLDHEIGRVLDLLKAEGLEENTLVVYTSDHGDMCGSHGMVDKHMVMYDDILRVPLMMRWPAVLPAGAIRDDFVSNAVDLPSTFCAAAGAEIPATFKGKSLLEPSGRKDIFAAYSGNQFGGYSARTVRDCRWKYIWNATAQDELYDFENDPGELCNLAADPQFANELSRLRNRLVVWMDSVNDPLSNPFTRQQLLG